MEKQSPIVENSLKALFSRTQKGLRDMTDRLDNFDIPEHNRAVDKRTIDTVLEDVQQEFEKFDRGAQEYHKPQCNIAMRSLIRYEKFRDDVNAIAPMWLADEYRDSTVKSHVKQFEGGDVRCQWTNPEIQLFKEAYRDKVRPAHASGVNMRADFRLFGVICPVFNGVVGNNRCLTVALSVLFEDRAKSVNERTS